MTRFHSTVSKSHPANSNIAVFAFDKGSDVSGGSLFGAALRDALEEARGDGFKGRAGHVAVVHPRNGLVARFLIVGLGSEADATHEALRRGAACAVRKAMALELTHLLIRPAVVGAPSVAAQAAIEGAVLGAYAYHGFRSTQDDSHEIGAIGLIARDADEEKEFDHGIRLGRIFGEATNFARDLINRPPSDTQPDMLAKVAQKVAGGAISLRIFKKDQIEKMGMGAVLGVNRGSSHPPYFLHFVYKPARKATRRIAICGKGITFDSGGLSLKPAKNMETMKYDMSGAAIVISILRALRELRPSVEVHGITPMTENMPGPNALKPGDVLHTMRGRTIEVLNTDAEGRLVLADALSYACRQPVDEIIDVATLTGACVVALGTGIAGIMGTDRRLVERLKNASMVSGEKIWELPLEKEYEPLLRSQVADIKNIGPVGQAGTILAGLFLKSFVDEGKSWAHLDIASTGWTDARTPLSDVGATGVMVRTLLHHILSYN